MKQPKGQTDKEKMEKALEVQGGQHYVLRLYVAGMTPKSTLAVTNIKKICEDHLAGRYSLEVIDLYKRPALAEGEQIIVCIAATEERFDQINHGINGGRICWLIRQKLSERNKKGLVMMQCCRCRISTNWSKRKRGLIFLCIHSRRA